MQKGLANRINLCKVTFLQSDYQHTIDFLNLDQQREYFKNKRSYIVDGNYILDSQRSSYLVNMDIQLLKDIDYLYVVEPNDVKCYYYFVTGVEYKTKTTTILYVKLDVFQTYLFDFRLGTSFVDRCHVPRWNQDGTPKFEVVPEDLQLTYHTITDIKDVYNYENKGTYIITSTEPLGEVDSRRKKNDSGTGGADIQGDWKNGIISSKGFRFMKGYEAFAPWSYRDSGGYYTIGYGITKHGQPTIYTDLLSQAPISEELAAKTSYNLKNSSYGKVILNTCKEIGVTTQQQFDALCDVAFNCGTGVITGASGLINILRKDIKNESAIRPIWEAFYTSDGTSIQPGLVARRKAECDIFFNGIYEKRAIPKVNQNGSISGTVTENNGDGWLPGDTGDLGDVKLTVENQYGYGYKPTTGTCTAAWPRYPSGGLHTGSDIANVTGTKIYAWRGGVVKSVGAGYGLGVIINHDDNKSMAIYGHNSVSYVKAGDIVKTGQLIALMGSTGNSTGPHLHFEIRPINGAYGTDVNPWYGLKYGDKV